MEAFRFAMRLVTGVLSLYTLLIMFRILLSWFPGQNFGRPVELLAKVTDPYLSWFRRFEFLKIGSFDFSVIVAIIALSIVSSITGRLAVAGQISLGFVLALILERLWSAASFFLVFFLVMAVIRVIGGFAGVNTSGRFWITLDRILEPVVHKIVLSLSRGRFVTYRNALLVFSGLIAVTLLLGGFLVRELAGLLLRIPI